MKRSGGFTLVEVVVALSILSLIMLATVSAMRTLANTQGAIDRMTQRVDEVRTVSSFLRDTMESAAVGGVSGGLTLGGGSGQASAFFELADDALMWRSTILFGESFGGSYMIRVAKEKDLLVLRWQKPDRTGKPGDWGETDARTLVTDLEEFELSWRKSNPGEWFGEWEKGDVAGWVRLQIRAAGRYWPELIMQVPR